MLREQLVAIDFPKSIAMPYGWLLLAYPLGIDSNIQHGSRDTGWEDIKVIGPDGRFKLKNNSPIAHFQKYRSYVFMAKEISLDYSEGSDVSASLINDGYRFTPTIETITEFLHS
jgi:hypothetical protein